MGVSQDACEYVYENAGLSRDIQSLGIEYVYENTGFEQPIQSLGIEYVYENTGAEHLVTPDWSEYVYEYVPDWSTDFTWIGPAPRLGGIDIPEDYGATSGQIGVGIGGGVGVLVGPYAVPEGKTIYGAWVHCQWISPEANGADIHWKLEDVAVDPAVGPNGLIFRIEYTAADSPLMWSSVANQWGRVSGSVPFGSDPGTNLDSFTTALASGQMALTFNPGSVGVRQVSSAYMAIYLHET